MSLLLFIFVVVIVLALALYAIRLLPMIDGTLSTILQLIAIVVAIFFIVDRAGWV